MNKPDRFLQDLTQAIDSFKEILESDYSVTNKNLADLVPFDKKSQRYDLAKIISEKNSGFEINHTALKNNFISHKFDYNGFLQVVVAYNMLRAIQQHYGNYRKAGLTNLYSTINAGKNDPEFKRAFNLLHHIWKLPPTSSASVSNGEQAATTEVETAAIHVYDEPSKKAASIIAELMDQLKGEENFIKDYLGASANIVLKLIGNFTNEDFQAYTASSAEACRYQVAYFESRQVIENFTKAQHQKISQNFSEFKQNSASSIATFENDSATSSDAYLDLLQKIDSTSASLKQAITDTTTQYQTQIDQKITALNEKYSASTGTKTRINGDHITPSLTAGKNTISGELLQLLNIFKPYYLASEELLNLTAKTAALELAADTSLETIEQLIKSWSKVTEDIKSDLEQTSATEPQFKLLNKKLLTAKELAFIYPPDLKDLTLQNAPLVMPSTYSSTLMQFEDEVTQKLQRLSLIAELKKQSQQAEQLQQNLANLSPKHILTSAKNQIELIAIIQQKIIQADYLQSEEKERLTLSGTQWTTVLSEMISTAQKTKEGLYEQVKEAHSAYQKAQQALAGHDPKGRQYITSNLASEINSLQSQADAINTELTNSHLKTEDLNKQSQTAQFELNRLKTTLNLVKAQLNTINQLKKTASNDMFEQNSQSNNLNVKTITLIETLAKAKNSESTISKQLEGNHKALEQAESQLKALTDLTRSVKNSLSTDDLSSLTVKNLIKAGFTEPELAVWQPVIERASNAKNSTYSYFANSLANSVVRMKDGLGNAEQLLNVINNKITELKTTIEQEKQQLSRNQKLNKTKNADTKKAEQALRSELASLYTTMEQVQQKINKTQESLVAIELKLEQTKQQNHTAEHNLSIVNQKLVTANLQKGREHTGEQFNQYLATALQQIREDHKNIIGSSERFIFDKALLDGLETDLLKLKPFISDANATHANEYKQLLFSMNNLKGNYAKHKLLDDQLQTITNTLTEDIKSLAFAEAEDKSTYKAMMETYRKQHQQLQTCQQDFLSLIKANEFTGSLAIKAKEVQQLLTAKFIQENQQFEASRSKQKEWIEQETLDYLNVKPEVLKGLAEAVNKALNEKIADQEAINVSERGIAYVARSLGLLVTQLPGLSKVHQWIGQTFMTKGEAKINALKEQQENFTVDVNSIQKKLKEEPHTEELYKEVTGLIAEGVGLGARHNINLTAMAQRVKLSETPHYPKGTVIPNWLNDKPETADLLKSADVEFNLKTSPR